MEGGLVGPVVGGPVEVVAEGGVAAPRADGVGETVAVGGALGFAELLAVTAHLHEEAVQIRHPGLNQAKGNQRGIGS